VHGGAIKLTRCGAAAGALLVVAVTALPAYGAAGQGERILGFDSVVTVSADAAVRVSETITYDFTTYERHGIYRTTTGRHTYVIEYTMDGAVTGAELIWNVTGSGWEIPIDTATATVTVPGGIERAACFAGPDGGRRTCDTPTGDVEGGTAHFAQSSLAPGDGLTVVVAVPAGSVVEPAPVLTPRRDLAAFRATPATVGGGVALAVLGVGAALLLAYLVGRDRRPRSLVGSAETGPLESSPPAGIRPGQTGTLLDERVHLVDITATIVDLAVRRFLRIRELPDGDWDLVQLGPPDATLLPYERTLFEALFNQRHRVRLSELRRTFRTDVDRIRRQLYLDTVGQGWYRRSPARTRIIAWTVAALILVDAAVATLILSLFHLGLIGVGLMVGTLALLIVARWLPARTAVGSEMLLRLKGFRQYLATVSAEQIRAEDRAQILSTYLPYAMVFGLADRWSATFSTLDWPPATANDGVWLYWYAGLYLSSMTDVTRSLNGFSAATTTSLGGTPATSGAVSVAGTGSGVGGGGGGSW
jgi:hypothetical protein